MRWFAAASVVVLSLAGLWGSTEYVPNDWQDTVPAAALPFPPATAPDALASQVEPNPRALDPPAPPAQDTQSQAPDDVWTSYFPDEPAEGATAEDAEPDAVAVPERKDLPV